MRILKNICSLVILCAAILASFFYAPEKLYAQEDKQNDNKQEIFIGKGGVKEVDFKEFDGVEEHIQLNGESKIVIDDFSITDKETYILRLTPRKPNANGQIAGSAFIKAPFKGFQEGFAFSTFFRLRVTADNIYDGSGIVFVIQSDRRGTSALGKCPNCMGYDGDFPGFYAIKPSLGVEFDIQESHEDLDYNMIGFDLHGDLNSVINSYIPSSMNNGIPWNVWVDYNGEILEVRMSMSSERPVSVTLVDRFRGQNIGIPLNLRSALTSTRKDMEAPPVYIGFTADPGRYPAFHDVLQFRFRPEYKPYGDYDREKDANIPYVDPNNTGYDQNL